MRYTFILAFLFLLVACAPKTLSYQEALDRNAKKLDNQNLRDDARFLVEAQNYNLTLLRLAEQADEKGYARVVADFADQLRTGHTKLSTELKEVAKDNKISLPAYSSKEMDRVVSEMLQVKPEKYDATFLRAIEALHEQAIREFESASSRANQPEIRAFAGNFLKMLNEHERKVDDLEDNLLMQ